MRGANQQFSQPNHVFNPSKYPDEDLLYDVDREVIPIAIHCVAEEGADGTSIFGYSINFYYILFVYYRTKTIPHNCCHS